MLLALATLALSTAVGPQQSAEPTADSLLTLLRSGGYIVMVRHTHTDRSVQDAQNYSSTDRSTQRNLSERGISDARMIGDVFRGARVAFGEISASPMFRTAETAELAFGTKPVTTMYLRELAPSAEQRAFVGKAPAAGTNRVLVTHHFIIERYAAGIRPGDVDEGEAVVVRPGDGETLALVGRFKLADWQRLSGRPPAVPAESDPHAAHSPAVRITSSYLRAFNTGNPDSMRVFLEASMTADPTRSMDRRVESYTATFAEHGPMSVVSHGTMSPGELSVRVRTRRGEFTLTVKMDAANGDRAASITLSSGGH